jgi:hypothetical protein
MCGDTRPVIRTGDGLGDEGLPESVRYSSGEPSQLAQEGLLTGDCVSVAGEPFEPLARKLLNRSFGPEQTDVLDVLRDPLKSFDGEGLRPDVHQPSRDVGFENRSGCGRQSSPKESAR